MKYDSKQLTIELQTLNYNRDITLQNLHKICGAIELVEAMHKMALETEEAEKTKEIESKEINDIDVVQVV